MQNKEGIQHIWVPLALAGLFAYLVSHCFITVYEMAIDTIFLCFCEDCEQNDGISKPYYMSRGLMVTLYKINHFIFLPRGLFLMIFFFVAGIR